MSSNKSLLGIRWSGGRRAFIGYDGEWIEEGSAAHLGWGMASRVFSADLCITTARRLANERWRDALVDDTGLASEVPRTCTARTNVHACRAGSRCYAGSASMCRFAAREGPHERRGQRGKVQKRAADMLDFRILARIDGLSQSDLVDSIMFAARIPKKKTIC